MLEIKKNEDEDKTIQGDNDTSGLGLPPVDQSKSNNVVPILDRSVCLAPVRFQSYGDGNWCDMLSKEIGSIIIGRPWLFDQNVTFQDQPNTYIFRSQDNKISVYPSPPPVYMAVDEFFILTCPETFNAIKADFSDFDEIIRLYLIMFDKCIQFNKYFRKILWHLLGTKLKYSSAYHKSLEKNSFAVCLVD